MAEFVEVMKQARRLCKTHGHGVDSCNKCPLSNEGECGYRCDSLDPSDELPVVSPDEFEKIVMTWASEHPEPRYPTWDEWFKKTFPDSEYTHCPCPNVFYRICNPTAYHGEVECYQCRNSPIPADIAVKLGIKPIGTE